MKKSYTKQRVDIIIYIKRRVLTRVFFWAKFHQLTDQKKESPVRPLQRVSIEKNFKKISYFLEKIYDSPDLHSQLVYLA